MPEQKQITFVGFTGDEEKMNGTWKVISEHDVVYPPESKRPNETVLTLSRQRPQIKS